MESTSRANVSSDPYLNYTAAGQPGSGGPPVTELRNADLEGALKAAVQAAFDGGLADGTEDPLHVTVWSTAPDPLFEDVYPPPKRSLAETGEGEFAATHHHGVRWLCLCVDWLVGVLVGLCRLSSLCAYIQHATKKNQKKTGGHHHHLPGRRRRHHHDAAGSSTPRRGGDGARPTRTGKAEEGPVGVCARGGR